MHIFRELVSVTDKTILVVDDEEDFCHLVKLNLETTHHSKVLTAYNVRDGIDMAILDFSQRQGISMGTPC